jgi:hypothetical protein
VVLGPLFGAVWVGDKGSQPPLRFVPLKLRGAVVPEPGTISNGVAVFSAEDMWPLNPKPGEGAPGKPIFL